MMTADDVKLPSATVSLLKRISSMSSKGNINSDMKGGFRKRVLSGEIDEVIFDLDEIEAASRRDSSVTQDDSGITVRKRAKTNWMVRIYKNFASKTGPSARGKRILGAYVGKDGIEVLEALFGIAGRMSGTSKGDELRKSFFTLALKAVSLFEHRVLLTPNSLEMCGTPLMRFMNALIEQLDHSFCFNPKELVDLGFVVFEGFECVLERGVSDNSIKKLRVIGDYFLTVAFFTELLQTPAYYEEMGKLRVGLRGCVEALHQKLLEPREDDDESSV